MPFTSAKEYLSPYVHTYVHTHACIGHRFHTQTHAPKGAENKERLSYYDIHRRYLVSIINDTRLQTGWGGA